jgi:Kef-type K+ transport system membrane component KefB
MGPATVCPWVLIGAVAVLLPIIAERAGQLAVPDVVIEIALGVLIGPACCPS